MPMAPKRPCSAPGCPELVEARFCERHSRAARQQDDARRGSAASRGYGRRWQKARTAYLAEHPLCRSCEAEGRVTAATVVDHVEPHRGDMAQFWSEANWQPLCKRHHDTKTASEDGGWGRPSAAGGEAPGGGSIPGASAP